MTIFDIIQSIADTSSLKEKQAILEKNKDNEVLKLCFLYAENPRFNFWIKGYDDVTAVALAGTSQEVIDLTEADFAKLDMLATRQVTGNAAREFVQNCLSALDPQSARIFSRILNRDLRCNCGTSLANKVWKNLIPEYPVMLCGKFDSKSEKYLRSLNSLIAQKKSDGGRVNVKIDSDGNVSYFSRNGSQLNLFGTFDSLFSKHKNSVFDGELLVRTKSGVADRKTGNGLYTKAVRGSLSQTEAESFVIDLWDVIPYDVFHGNAKPVETYATRLEKLLCEFDMEGTGAFNRVMVVESASFANLDHCIEFYEMMRRRGEEGIIIKDPDQVWEDRRSKGAVKMKAEETGDFLCVGWEYGDKTSKFANCMGSLICESADGLVRFNVGSGFKEDERDGDKYVNKIIEVAYNEVIASRDRKDGTKSLFLPIFKQIRYDKNVANTLAELK